MDKEAYRIAYLIAGFIRNTITDKEHQELDDWVNATDKNMLLFEELTDEKNLEANLAWMDQTKSEESFKKLQESGSFKKQTKTFRLKPIWIAAASVILLAGALFIYRNSTNKTGLDNDMAIMDTTILQPGGNRATLTLSDGSVIDLTRAKNGLVASENESDIIKTSDGQLVYEGNNLPSEISAINKLSTPVGGQFQVKLPDGTKVWLNAATTLRYPARFPANERTVEIDGEAYFEVAKNNKQPFRVVLSDNSTVNVIGTHFNVMAYGNENAKDVTLLEGSVLVRSNNKTETLQPGMQAKITANTLTKKDEIDTEQIIGWKNGLFVFHDATIQSIMRQVERWYDAKVVFKGETKQLFNATISRREPLSKLLRLLELNGYVHFKIENKIIYVLP